MNDSDTVKILNGLIQTSEDGKKGFADAAEQATQQNLKTVFLGRSTDCATAASELQALVGSLGGTAEESGTLSGAALRGWGKVRSAFGDADLALLEAAESAEDTAKAVYAKALASDLPEPIRVVVQRQGNGAVRNHDLIRKLRDDYRATAKETAN